MTIPNPSGAPDPTPSPEPRPAPLPTPTPGPSRTPAPTLGSSLSVIDRWKFGIEILVGVLTLVTLFVLAMQTVAANEQAEQAVKQSKEAAKQSAEAANQGAAQRLDATYERLLDRKEWLASQENSRITGHIFRGTPLEEIKDEVEREQVAMALVWDLAYVDYLYEMLPGLVDCAPEDRHLELRETGKMGVASCDDWAAWSEYIYSVFTDSRVCELLKESQATYGVGLVSAIRATDVCEGIL
ncbi:hypothetical protein [Streptomyces sp. NPDC060205]|uniref:hypothetical protein n=1 Tax=Streptomyces sp. NPDC060205 TaxID=3347072 RepID=UPI0036665259